MSAPSGSPVPSQGLNVSNTLSFDDMELKPELLRGVYAYGFERPSAIQQRAIMPIITGRDVIAQAQSGTGKTATFSISILQRVSIIDDGQSSCDLNNKLTIARLTPPSRRPRLLSSPPPVSSPSRSRRSSSPLVTTSTSTATPVLVEPPSVRTLPSSTRAPTSLSVPLAVSST